MADELTETIKTPRYDQNFLVEVQTNDAVPANVISRLVAALDESGIGARVQYIGTIDYDTVTAF